MGGFLWLSVKMSSLTDILSSRSRLTLMIFADADCTLFCMLAFGLSSVYTQAAVAAASGGSKHLCATGQQETQTLFFFFKPRPGKKGNAAERLSSSSRRIQTGPNGWVFSLGAVPSRSPTLSKRRHSMGTFNTQQLIAVKSRQSACFT